MGQDAHHILNTWIKAVNTKCLDDVVGLYSEHALLLPTFSNRVLENPKSITDYFKKLASREHLNVTVHDKTVRVHHASEDIQIISGIYCWIMDVEGERLNFEARFTFVSLSAL